MSHPYSTRHSKRYLLHYYSRRLLPVLLLTLTHFKGLSQAWPIEILPTTLYILYALYIEHRTCSPVSIMLDILYTQLTKTQPSYQLRVRLCKQQGHHYITYCTSLA
jgi:hypothetical protein